MASRDAPPNTEEGLDGQVENILSLVLARSRGEVGNEAVETALSSIVATHAPTSSSVGRCETDVATRGRTAQQNKDDIIPDDGNYDDDSEYDDDAQEKATTKKYASVTNTSTKKVALKKSRERDEALENIPLGKMGERMLITFGDGPCPEEEVIEAALLGTRQSLQRAILDARALRRKLKDSWHHARAVAQMHRGAYATKEEMKKTTSGVQSSVAVMDSELSFRAMDGCADGIRYDVGCGFDVSQLETLFPEEMGAYQRWKKMHDAYSDKSGEEEVPKKSEEDLISDDKEEDEMELETAKINSSRLVERLSQFDARTNKMADGWYLKFADVRRGSFLPRASGRQKQNSETAEWKERCKKRGRLPAKDRMTWQRLSPTSVIFLHWIGFDPMSALSPPNEEATQALGYLAYDFFGKIVEKAVSLRLESSKRENKKRKPHVSRSDSLLLELTGGDQLEKKDIEQAIAEVDLNSLCSSSNVDLGKSAKITQLYFGPGFEDRLELEMDEIFGSKDKLLSKEEMEARKEEEHLFSELPEVPTLRTSASNLGDNDSDEYGTKNVPATKKCRK